MRFVGIDVAAQRHVVAVVDETDRVLIKATPFTEDADGYVCGAAECTWPGLQLSPRAACGSGCSGGPCIAV